MRDIVLHSLFEGRNLGQSLGIDRLRFRIGRYPATEIFVRQHYGAVHEISENGNEFAVVAGLEVLPCEVVVLRLGSICA